MKSSDQFISAVVRLTRLSFAILVRAVIVSTYSRTVEFKPQQLHHYFPIIFQLTIDIGTEVRTHNKLLSEMVS